MMARMDAAQLPTGPRVGAKVILSRDVLVEVARQASGTPSIWQMLEAGTRGKLLGWRERAGETPRAVVELRDREKKLVVFVGETNVTPA
jgi:hypothetical protein